MINSTLAQLALRNRLLSLTIANTGSTELVATTTGYTRPAGSFLAEGFAPGMEITPTGFPANPVDVISEVTATTITTAAAHAAAASASGRTIAAKLPVGRAFDNATFTPTAGRPWIEEDFVPLTHSLITFPASNSHAEERGIYVVTFYGLVGKGFIAIRRSVDAIKALYAPGTNFPLSDGSVVRVPTDTAPWAGQLIPLETGYAAVVVTIPWRARSRNTIAA